MDTKGVFSHNTDEWNTPKELFNQLNEIYSFTLDPCSTEKNHLCKKFYTSEDNGLVQSWKNEIVFCNPPYSKCAEWVRKAFYENLINNVLVVILLPVRTDTKYFHDYICEKADIFYKRASSFF